MSISRLACLALLGVGALSHANSTEEARKNLAVEFASPAVIVSGDASLTLADLQAHVGSIPEEDRSAFVNSPQRIADTAEQQMREERLAMAGLRAGLLDDPLRNAQLYRNAMQSLARWHMEGVVKARTLENYEQQGREIYLSNPERFREEPTVTFTHLLIRTGEQGEEAAMRKILEMVDALETGAEFEDLVIQHSEDPTVSENDGTYSSVSPDRLDDNFASALQALEPGETSGPVRSRFGWHLIRLDSTEAGEIKNWEDASAEATKLAEQRHADRIRQAYLQELTSSQPADILADVVTQLQELYGSTSSQSEG